MSRIRKLVLFLAFPMIALASQSYAGDAGLFRTVPVVTPPPGMFSVSNGSFYSKTRVNDVLVTRYGVERPRLLSSVTDFELGILRSFALTGSLPYYADLFSQNGRSGHKAGGGDVTAGIRASFGVSESPWDRVSLGARVLIPARFGYGTEPPGFRTFSSGELGFGLESAARMPGRFADIYASASLYRYPHKPESGQKKAGSDDVFYETGFGYKGIGEADAVGHAATIFQNQAALSLTGIVPLNRSTAAVLELGTTVFTEKPRRETILRLVPGVRFGNPDGINLSAGVDIRLKGQVPKTTALLRLNVPSLSPKDLGRGFRKQREVRTEERILARNVLVAVNPFSKEDYTYLYENELREAFQKALGSMEILAVIPNGKTDLALARADLAPVKDSPQNMGVRLGSHYLISADISSSRSSRKSGFAVPFVISFPETEFTLSAHTQVTDLVTGVVVELGAVSATVTKRRGVVFFPAGPSSDIIQLSATEERRMEKELINRWVDGLNSRIIERLDLFDWEPKRTNIRGGEDTSG